MGVNYGRIRNVKVGDCFPDRRGQAVTDTVNGVNTAGGTDPVGLFVRSSWAGQPTVGAPRPNKNMSTLIKRGDMKVGS